MTKLNGSISTGHSSTQAWQVVQDHAAFSVIREPIATSLSYKFFLMFWTRALGLRSVPAIKAGHARSHLPQSVHASASTFCISGTSEIVFVPTLKLKSPDWRASARIKGVGSAPLSLIRFSEMLTIASAI